MNNTQTPDTMSDLEYYNAALARFDSQPIGRAKLYLQSTLDGFQRANDPDKYPANAQRFDEAQALLRDFFKFGEASDISEFAAWVEATIQRDTACNVPVYICDEIRREGVSARRKFYNIPAPAEVEPACDAGAEYLRDLVAWVNARPEYDNDGKTPAQIMSEFDQANV